MFEATANFDNAFPQPRVRLVRDSVDSAPAALKASRISLHQGEMYRIAYSNHGSGERVSRSVALYEGESKRRSWKGDVVSCLDFALPQGRKISLLADQLVDARAAVLGDRGKWILVNDGRARGRRRSSSQR
jgi:hypothetical protein